MDGWVISFTSPIEAEVLRIGLFNTFTFSLFSSLSLFGFRHFFEVKNVVNFQVPLGSIRLRVYGKFQPSRYYGLGCGPLTEILTN